VKNGEGIKSTKQALSLKGGTRFTLTVLIDVVYISSISYYQYTRAGCPHPAVSNSVACRDIDPTSGSFEGLVCKPLVK
jgi:hypothetical protein